MGSFVYKVYLYWLDIFHQGIDVKLTRFSHAADMQSRLLDDWSDAEVLWRWQLICQRCWGIGGGGGEKGKRDRVGAQVRHSKCKNGEELKGSSEQLDSEHCQNERAFIIFIICWGQISCPFKNTKAKNKTAESQP